MTATPIFTLPEPGDAAKAHSARVAGRVSDKLSDGMLSFSDYMQTVLYEPGLGYYMNGTEKFGAAGDFVTAPETSMLFGLCVARQCNEILQRIGGSIVEFGAGSGRLCASVLNGLTDTLPEHYWILEPSADLQQRQRSWLEETLPTDLFERVGWITAMPVDFEGVCVANEVLDAMPVERFKRGADGFIQCCVSRQNDQFIWRDVDAPAALSMQLQQMETSLGDRFDADYCSEINMLVQPWIESLARSIKRGVVLLADYGYPRREYYLPERREGTLACYYQHRFHDDVFWYPGLQDITAHVDFTRVVESGSAAGMALLGYTSQASFLINCGLTSIASEQMQLQRTEQAQLTLANEIKRLTLPGEMGERFQVMALGKNFASPLQGFVAQDWSHRL